MHAQTSQSLIHPHWILPENTVYIWASVKNKESSGDSLSGHNKVKEKKGSALSPGGKRKSTHPQKNYA